MRRVLLGLLLLGFGPLAGFGSDPIADTPLPKIPALLPIPANPSWGEPGAPANWKKAAHRSDDHATDDSKPTASPPAILPNPRSLPAEKPTDVKALRDEMDKLLKLREELQPEAGSGTTDERSRLRSQLNDLLKKLDQPKSKPSVGKEKPHAPSSKVPLPEGGRPIDAMRLGINVYKTGDVRAALETFRLIDLSRLSGEDRAFAQYLTACCLRQTGKVAEATAIFREILDEKADPLLTECALTQLGLIRSTRDLDAQIEQLRARRKGK